MMLTHVGGGGIQFLERTKIDEGGRSKGGWALLQGQSQGGRELIIVTMLSFSTPSVPQWAGGHLIFGLCQRNLAKILSTSAKSVTAKVPTATITAATIDSLHQHWPPPLPFDVVIFSSTNEPLHHLQPPDERWHQVYFSLNSASILTQT